MCQQINCVQEMLWMSPKEKSFELLLNFNLFYLYTVMKIIYQSLKNLYSSEISDIQRRKRRIYQFFFYQFTDEQIKDYKSSDLPHHIV